MIIVKKIKFENDDEEDVEGEQQLEGGQQVYANANQKYPRCVNFASQGCQNIVRRSGGSGRCTKCSLVHFNASRPSKAKHASRLNEALSEFIAIYNFRAAQKGMEELEYQFEEGSKISFPKLTQLVEQIADHIQIESTNENEKYEMLTSKIKKEMQMQNKIEEFNAKEVVAQLEQARQEILDTKKEVIWLETALETNKRDSQEAWESLAQKLLQSQSQVAKLDEFIAAEAQSSQIKVADLNHQLDEQKDLALKYQTQLEEQMKREIYNQKVETAKFEEQLRERDLQVKSFELQVSLSEEMNRTALQKHQAAQQAQIRIIDEMRADLTTLQKIQQDKDNIIEQLRKDAIIDQLTIQKISQKQENNSYLSGSSQHTQCDEFLKGDELYIKIDDETSYPNNTMLDKAHLSEGSEVKILEQILDLTCKINQLKIAKNALKQKLSLFTD